MRAPATVRADGIEWPFATFLDAFGYRAVDRFSRPDLDGQRRIWTIDDAGQVLGPTFADQVTWIGIRAYRPVDGRDEPPPCFLCDTSADPDDVCDECWGTAEFEA